jgi:hypothetical protein
MPQLKIDRFLEVMPNQVHAEVRVQGIGLIYIPPKLGAFFINQKPRQWFVSFGRSSQLNLKISRKTDKISYLSCGLMIEFRLAEFEHLFLNDSYSSHLDESLTLTDRLLVSKEFELKSESMLAPPVLMVSTPSQMSQAAFHPLPSTFKNIPVQSQQLYPSKVTLSSQQKLSIPPLTLKP